jgi:hypothetical protein
MEELREAAVIHSAKHQQAKRWYHAWSINSRNFSVGNFILQKIEMTKDWHKLSPIWEEPFEVVEVTQPSSYGL